MESDDTTTTKPSPVRVFISYSHEDTRYAAKLIKHLALMKQQGEVEAWIDGKIVPGQVLDEEIRVALETSDVILLLISSNFIASDYCYKVEMQRALERHEAGVARVIPIMIKPVDGWQSSPFGSLKVVPKDGIPVTGGRHWKNQDEAWADAVGGIRASVRELAWLRRDVEIAITTVGSLDVSGGGGGTGTTMAQDTEDKVRTPVAPRASESTAVLSSLRQTKEFEVLDVAWKKLQDAVSSVASLTRLGVFTIPDFRAMSDDMLRTYLESRQFNQDDVKEILSQDPAEREREYLQRAKWYDFHGAELAVAELNNHLVANEIYLTLDLTTTFHEVVLKLRYALNKYLTGLQVIQQGGDLEGNRLLREAYDEAFPRADEARAQIKVLIQQRLQ